MILNFSYHHSMDRINFMKALLAFIISISFTAFYFHPTRKDTILVSSHRGWYCPEAKLPENGRVLTYLLNLDNKKIPMLRLGNGCFTPKGKNNLPELNNAKITVVEEGKSFVELFQGMINS